MEYRFVFCPAMGGAVRVDPFYGDPVNNKSIAKDQLNAVANYTLHLHSNNLMTDFSNMGFFQERESSTDDWVDVMDDDF